jgi:hypothetical protein
VKPCLCGTDYFRKQASRRKATSLEIMGMLPTLGELLPRLDESSLVSPTAPQVQEALISIYSDLLGFCAKVHRSYSQSGACKFTGPP